MDFLSYFALGLILFVILVLLYGMVAIHDIPYLLAKKRNHPHQDAIHAGGWVSLFTLHAIWPFLWIWAAAYHPEHGYRGRPTTEKTEPDQKAPEPTDERILELEKRIAQLEANSPKQES